MNVFSSTAVPLRNTIFMAKLESEGSSDNIKSDPAVNAPSGNLYYLSIFKLSPFETRAITSHKISVATENLLNKSLSPLIPLIKESAPRDKPRNTNPIVLPPAKNLMFPQTHDHNLTKC